MSAVEVASRVVGKMLPQLMPKASSPSCKRRARLLSGTASRPHLIHFRFIGLDFFLPELDSLLVLQGIDPKSVYDSDDFDPDIPFLRATFPSNEAIRMVCSRAVRIRAIYELWGAGNDYQSLIESVRDTCPSSRKAPYFDQNQRWCMKVESFGLKLSTKNAAAKRDYLLRDHGDVFAFQGKVELSNPDRNLFWLLENFENNLVSSELATKEKISGSTSLSKKKEKKLQRKMLREKIYEEIRTGLRPKRPRQGKAFQAMRQSLEVKPGHKLADQVKEHFEKGCSDSQSSTPSRVSSEASTQKMEDLSNQISSIKESAIPNAIFFCREIARSQVPTEKYSLKHRSYLGPTSMEAEMAFLMANQALAAPNKLVMDPFVGTGSILLPCTVLGATCMGGDIDYYSLGGKLGKTPLDSFNQYNLPHPDLIRLDFSPRGRCIREPVGGLFDAVVCDPPYGIRAGAKKCGSAKEIIKAVPEENRAGHIPMTQAYPVEDLMCDLVDAAARLLKVGGRLVYLMPVLQTEYCDDHIPQHECLEIIANSEQKLRYPLARRLVTMRKHTEYDYGKATQYLHFSQTRIKVPSFENLYRYNLENFH